MAEIKQYINLEPDGSDKALGRTKKVKVTMENDAASLVYLFLSPDGANENPVSLKADHRAGIGAPSIEKSMTISGVDKTIEFDFVLSNYGGDKFEVKASLDVEGKTDLKKISDTFVVWKKLFYQVSSMKASLNFSLDNVKNEYGRHFIELEETSSIIVPYVENLETAELPTYRQYFKKQKSPFEMHVVLIDRQCDSDAISFDHKMTSVDEILPYSDDAWPFSNWLAGAQSSVAGAAFIENNISVTQVPEGLRVNISGLGVDPTKVDVQVQIVIRVLEGEYGGDASFPPHVFIAVDKYTPHDMLSMTLVHEMGHGIGMVPKSEHPLHYNNSNGGKGNHCRHGADQNDVSLAQGGVFRGEYSNGTCVMYHAQSKHYKFCDTCKKFVRDAMMYEQDLNSRGWGK